MALRAVKTADISNQNATLLPSWVTVTRTNLFAVHVLSFTMTNHSMRKTQCCKKRKVTRKKSRRGLTQWYVPWLRYERMTSRQTFIQVWCPQKIHRHLLDSYCRERLKQYLVSLSCKDHRHRRVAKTSAKIVPASRCQVLQQLLGKGIVPRESWKWTQEG